MHVKGCVGVAHIREETGFMHWRVHIVELEDVVIVVTGRRCCEDWTKVSKPILSVLGVLKT